MISKNGPNSEFLQKNCVKAMGENPWWYDTMFPQTAKIDRQWWLDQTQLDWAAFGASWGANPKHGVMGRTCPGRISANKTRRLLHRKELRIFVSKYGGIYGSFKPKKSNYC